MTDVRYGRNKSQLVTRKNLDAADISADKVDNFFGDVQVHLRQKRPTQNNLNASNG